MEHRLGKRKKTYGSVELWQGAIKRGNFELVNIGSGGLFLRCGQKELIKGEIFAIKSQLDNQAGINDYRLKAMVVHHSKDGVGLMWVGCRTTFFTSLQNILNQAA